MSCALQLHRALHSWWQAHDPIPAEGEPVFSIDTGVLKIGNGFDQWSILPAINGGGVGDDKHFAFTQNTPSAIWVITHSMNKYPAVSIVDSANQEVEGEVEYVSPNQLIVSFSAAFSGKAYCN